MAPRQHFVISSGCGSSCKLNGPSAAGRAGDAIVQGVQTLEALPRIERLVEDLPELTSYRIDDDVVTILVVRHQKEAGYQS